MAKKKHQKKQKPTMIVLHDLLQLHHPRHHQSKQEVLNYQWIFTKPTKVFWHKNYFVDGGMPLNGPNKMN